MASGPVSVFTPSNMLHHLRVAVPAVAAVVWAVQKLRGRGEEAPCPAPAADQDEGAEAEVELPAGKGPQLPFPQPAPLKATLLDVTLPVSLSALWLALFHNASSLLADFHQQLGDLDIDISRWRQKDDTRRRVMRYTTPLRNPLGPRQARNTEVMEVGHLGASGFSLRTRCSSEGVPFSTCFANHVQWVATPAGTHSCRLLVTGECQFHSPVWGPLKGQIERESIKGMTQAYRTLIRMLERQYGGVAASADKSSSSSGGAPAAAGKASSSSGGASAPAGKAARRPLSLGADATAAGAAAAAAGLPADEEGLNISALLQNPQANAAAFLAFVVVMVLLWRIAVAQPLAMQAMRAAASAVGR